MPVRINNKDYRTVAERLDMFRKDHDITGSIVTDIISNADGVVVIKATILLTTGVVLGTGHAEEVRGSTNINKTSALENCETSAIGRALASAGYAGTEFASADELVGALSQERANDDSLAQAMGEDPGAMVLTIGKYRGEKSIQWVADNDEKYTRWMLENVDSSNANRIALGRFVESGKCVIDYQ
jgi:hypothetical protein